MTRKHRPTRAQAAAISQNAANAALVWLASGMVVLAALVVFTA